MRKRNTTNARRSTRDDSPEGVSKTAAPAPKPSLEGVTSYDKAISPFRLLLVLVLVVLAATGAYVFTASNTVLSTKRFRSGVISGDTVTSVA